MAYVAKKEISKPETVCNVFVNVFFFVRIVSSEPSPKLEDRHFSAAGDCLVNIFEATLYIWRSSPVSASYRRVDCVGRDTFNIVVTSGVK